MADTEPAGAVRTLASGTFTDAKFSADGTRLFAVRGSTVSVFDVATGATLSSYTLAGTLGGFDLSADGRFLAVAQLDPVVGSDGQHHARAYVIDLTSGATAGFIYQGSLAAFTDASFLANGQVLLSEADRDTTGATLVTLDPSTGAFATVATTLPAGATMTATADHREVFLVATGYTQPSAVYTSGVGITASRLDQPDPFAGASVPSPNRPAFAIAPDGSRVADTNGGLQLLGADLQAATRLTFAGFQYDGLAFGASGRELYAAGGDDIVAFDLATGRATAILPVGDTTLPASSFGLGGILQASADGHYLSVLGTQGLQLIDLTKVVPIAGPGNDTLSGSGTVHGLGGDDTLSAVDPTGFSFTTLYGDQGDDTYFVTTGREQVAELAGDGIDTIVSSISTGLPDNVENLVLTDVPPSGYAVAQTGQGNELANSITGNSAANDLSGFDGNDVLAGGDGNDVLAGGNGADVLNGGTANDVLDGGAGDDQLSGGDGNDTINASAGHDSVDGGTGTDRLVVALGDPARFDAVAGPITYTIAGAHVGASQGGLDVTLTAVEQVIITGSGNAGDTLVIDTAGSSIIGVGATLGNGDNVVTASGPAGSIRLSLGDGNDRISVDGNLGGTVYTGLGSDTVTGNGQIAVTVGVDSGLGTAVATRDEAGTTTITYTGAAGPVATTVNGAGSLLVQSGVDGQGLRIDATHAGSIALLDLAGDDMLVGSRESDTLAAFDGGASTGHDLKAGNGGADVFDYSFAPPTDLGDHITDLDADDLLNFSFYGSFTFLTGATQSIEADLDFLGTGGFTGAGRELRYEDVGHTTVVQVDMDGDRIADGQVTIDNGAFTLVDRGDASAPNQLGIDLSQHVVAGTDAADALAGTAAADVIRSNDGDDRIALTGGQDFIDGGSGRDGVSGTIRGGQSYVVSDARVDGGGFDTALTGIEQVALHATGGGTVKVDGSAATLALALYGGTGNDVLTGGAGADYLDGGSNRDRMVGGAGDDRYVVREANDAVVEQAGGGTDTVVAYTDYTLAGEVERLELAGHARAGTGNALANDITGTIGGDRLVGMDGADILRGGGGEDALSGGAGDDDLRGGTENDGLSGGAGQDKLSGGTGSDRFAFVDGDVGATIATADRVTDFSHAEHDLLVFKGMDADTTRVGDQDFRWIGTAAFDGHAGELHYAVTTNAGGVSTAFVSGDTNGDGLADFYVRLDFVASLEAADVKL